MSTEKPPHQDIFPSRGVTRTRTRQRSFGTEKQSHVRAVLATPRVLRLKTLASSEFSWSFPAQIVQNSELLQAGDLSGNKSVARPIWSREAVRLHGDRNEHRSA